MSQARSSVFNENHNLAIQAQREQQSRRNAASAQAMARIEARKARMAQGRTEIAIRALAEARALKR
jgi:hypothetical protein